MSSSHPAHYSSYSLPAPMQDSVRLPSIKDLNFPPPGQDGAPANAQGRPEHARPRHESWSRPSAPSGPVPQPQHSSAMPPPHDPPPKHHHYAHQPKPDPPYAQPAPSPQQTPQGIPTHNGASAGAPRPENPADASSNKRSRSQQGVSVSPGRSPHTMYPPYPTQAPQTAYHQGPPSHVPPPPPPEHLQQPPHYAHQPPPPGYAPYPQSMPRGHYGMPPPAPPHHQGQPPPSQYAPPAEHWQQPPAQPQPSPQQQFNGYTRTTPLVPAPIEARAPAPPVPSPADAERANARHQVIAEILKHCNVLYGFANHYANVTRQHPQMQPAPQEIEEMNYHASTVMRLLEDLRRIEGGEDISRKEGDYPAAGNTADEQVRPPKRPWEDMARDGEPPAPIVHYDTAGHSPHPDEQAQSTAEQDMQIIRNKRQSSTGGAVPGQQKNKYRKRSRATPPGKCHSCNIRETPEWRRGPDGARTLCNACGLHYAKLMRKRDKALDANGKAPPIDLQTLRASTASARGAGGGGPGGGGGSEHGGEPSHSQPHQPPPPHQGQPPPSPYDQPKQMHAGAATHPGPYQLMPVGAAGASGGPAHPMMPPPHGPGSAPHSATGGPPPPPPWLASGGDRPGYNGEPPSYVRASHPPSHARASPQ